MSRCCLCRHQGWASLEATDLPGSGWRCIDRHACRMRVREILDAHTGLAEALEAF